MATNKKMRDGLNTMEMGQLVAELKAQEGNWEATKKVFPLLNPKVLDEGFKVWAFKQAGIPLPAEKPADPKAKPVIDPLK